MRYAHILCTGLLYACIGFLCAGACLFGISLYIIHNHVIDFAQLEQQQSLPSILLDDTGAEWARFQLEKRDPILLADMPPHLIHAFIAAEDWHFFAHHGISWRGVLRSIWVNLSSGRCAQGASTITQQLVRLLFLDAQKTFVRKIKEQIYALLVEQQFTKEYILQTYLNHIYFGCGMYGLEAASQHFWHTSAAHVTIDQAATLAAIICAPNRYCPLLYPLSTQRRRNVILHSMHKLGYITAEEYRQAIATSLQVDYRQDTSPAPHIKEMLRIQLEDLVGKKALYTGGLVIQTTINKEMQMRAQEAFTQQIEQLRAAHAEPFDGALLAIDTQTGAIKAYVGGYSFADSKYDRVRLAQRQIGSTFKVLIYAAAIQAGKKVSDVAYDEPLSLVQPDGAIWSPRNYTRDFKGQMTLAYALSRSNNIVAIKTLLDIGMQPVIDLAIRCHLKDTMHPYPSLALGCIDASLMSVVGMFNIFANRGQYVEPYSLVWIQDHCGNKIWKRAPKKAEQIVDMRTTGQVAKVLMLGIERLQKRYAHQLINVDALCKTGTTNDSRTCWFMGSTPSLTTGVYIGCDDNRPMGRNIFPVHTAFPIWLAFNTAIEHTRSQFVYDPSLQDIIIDERTGQRLSCDSAPGAIHIFV